MSIVLDCPSCRKAVSATRELIGRIMACPHCAGQFTIIDERGTAVLAPPRPNEQPSAFRSNIRYTFACQRCQSILEAVSEHAGKQGACPTCGAVFIIPEVDPRTGQAIGPAHVADDGQLPTPMHAYATAGHRAPKIQRLESGEQIIVCPRCRQQMPIDANGCGKCGIPFTLEGAAAAATVHYASSSYAVAAVTVGVLSLLTFCMPILSVVAIGLGIAGLSQASKRAQSGTSEVSARDRGMSIAGIVMGCGSIGLFLLSM